MSQENAPLRSLRQSKVFILESHHKPAIMKNKIIESFADVIDDGRSRTQLKDCAKQYISKMGKHRIIIRVNSFGTFKTFIGDCKDIAAHFGALLETYTVDSTEAYF